MFRYLSRTLPRRTRVLVRVDFNVPIEQGRVRDDFDLLRVLPTIRALQRRRNTCVLLSHHSDEHQSLAPLAKHLSLLLSTPVLFLRDPFSRRAALTVRRAPPGAGFLAENLRFWRGEKANGPAFAAALARLGEVFVNDAFGELHRPYASIIGIPRLLPSLVGPLVLAELGMLGRFMHRPRRPLIGIFGGAKVETKLAILKRFFRFADRVLAGGGVANTLLKARGLGIGRSLAAPASAAVRRLARSRRLVLPTDVIVKGPRSRVRRVPVAGVTPQERICDIGPETRLAFRHALGPAKTVIWNGPLGLAEDRRYAAGTLAIARALARHRGLVLVGGGDTVAFLRRVGLRPKFRYVSTGGGAMLAYLAGEKLPGLEALKGSRESRT